MQPTERLSRPSFKFNRLIAGFLPESIAHAQLRIVDVAIASHPENEPRQCIVASQLQNVRRHCLTDETCVFVLAPPRRIYARTAENQHELKRHCFKLFTVIASFARSCEL